MCKQVSREASLPREERKGFETWKSQEHKQGHSHGPGGGHGARGWGWVCLTQGEESPYWCSAGEGVRPAALWLLCRVECGVKCKDGVLTGHYPKSRALVWRCAVERAALERFWRRAGGAVANNVGKK